MNILYFIIPALLMILLSIYLYYYIARALRRVKVDVKKNQVKLIIIALVLIIMYFSLRDLGIGIVVLLHIVVLALVMDLLNYIFKILSKRNTIAFNKWRTVYESGIVPIILTAISDKANLGSQKLGLWLH